MPAVLTPQKPPGLWHGTPPAVFPPILGLLGLGVAWRRAGVVFGFGPELSDLILGAVSLLALFALISYAAKVARRPGVVIDDLRVLPGRAGLAAATMSVMLLALVMLRYSPGAARALLWVGLVLHAGLALLILRGLATGPGEQRRVTPVWHLSFVGFIVAALSATPLGFVVISMAILGFTLALAVVIWSVSAWQFAAESVPAPLRPLLAIHLAPMSLFATVSAELQMPAAALGFGVLAVCLLIVLVASMRWLTVAGFTPFWGAFTFPLAASASAMLALADLGQGVFWQGVGGLLLVAATIAIPPIAVKVMKAWARGELGRRTNAAVA